MQEREPLVLVALKHPAMRRLISELLHHDEGWDVRVVDGDLESAVNALKPALVIVDAPSTAACTCGHDATESPEMRTIVVVPEPDPAYGTAALERGAHGWVARDCVADDLSRALRDALGCPCAPPPRLDSGRASTLAFSTPHATFAVGPDRADGQRQA